MGVVASNPPYINLRLDSNVTHAPGSTGIVKSRLVEQCGALRHDTDGLADGEQRHGAQILPVDDLASAQGIFSTISRIDQRYMSNFLHGGFS